MDAKHHKEAARIITSTLHNGDGQRRAPQNRLYCIADSTVTFTRADALINFAICLPDPFDPNAQIPASAAHIRNSVCTFI
jgi:hypothetical protein